MPRKKVGWILQQRAGVCRKKVIQNQPLAAVVEVYAELSRLRAEYARLRMGNEILKIVWSAPDLQGLFLPNFQSEVQIVTLIWPRGILGIGAQRPRDGLPRSSRTQGISRFEQGRCRRDQAQKTSTQ